MKEMKRVLALILCVAMLVGVMPVSALATEEESTAETSASTSEPAEDTSAEPSGDPAENSGGESSESPAAASEEGASETPAGDSTGEEEDPTEDTQSEEIAVTGIALDQTTLKVGVGAEPVTLVATVTPEDATDQTVVWTSSEEGVASVADGVVTFGYMGEAVITATAGEYSATCAVTVGEGVVAVYDYTGPEYLDAAIFCSDVHKSTSDLTSVLGGVKTSGVTYSSIGFVGDTCLTVANTESTVNSALGYTPKVMFSYAASHDTENSADISTDWDYSGEVEDVSDYYLVYTIRETDMQYSSNATTASAAFTTWYNGLTAAQKKLPIFVMSHRPIHARRGGNQGGEVWTQAFNAAGATSDIVVFWAHNHTGETSVDTGYYYVAKGGTVNVATSSGSSSTANESGTGEDYKIAFTYMNAGYINANNQDPERLNVATTVRITADSLIFQDYTTSGEYTDSSYSHNVTVTREFASGTDSGDSGDSGDTGDTETGDTTTTSKTVYVLTDTMTVGKNYLIANGNSGSVTLLGQSGGSATTTTATVVTEGDYTYIETADTGYIWNATAHPNSSYSSYPRLINAETYAMYLGNSAVSFSSSLTATTGAQYTRYWTYTDGVMACPSTNSDSTTYYLTYSGSAFASTSTSATGIYIYEEQTISVETEATLSSIAVTTEPTTTYNVGDAFSTEGMVVTATYSDGTTAAVTGYSLSGVDMNTVGTQTVTVTYTEGDVTRTTTFNITVNEVISDTATVTGIKVTGVDTAYFLGEEFSTEGMVVTATYDDNGTTKTAEVTDYMVDSSTVNTGEIGEYEVTVSYTYNGETVTDTYTVTVTEIPSNEVTRPTTTTTTTTKTVYVLTSSISSGNSYLIVNGNSAGSYNALANNNGSVAATGVTVKTDSTIGTYIELDDATDELWTVSGSYAFKNGSYYLSYSSSNSGNDPGGSNNNNTTYSIALSTSSRTWSYSSSNNRLSVSISNRSYYLRYNNGWSISTSTGSVYFYVPTEIEVETTVETEVTYTMRAEDLKQVVDGTEIEATLDYCLQGDGADLTTLPSGGSYSFAVLSDGSDIIASIDSDGKITFTGKTGKATVKVAYTWTEDGETYTVYKNVTVEAVEPYYTIDLHLADYSYDEVDIDAFAEGITYYVKNEDGTYSEVASDAQFDADTTYYVLGNVTVGEEITAPVAIKGVEAGDTYSIWAVIKEYTAEYSDGNDLGDVEDSQIYWHVSDTSIATVDPHTGVITFTGNNYGTFTVTAYYLDEEGNVLCEDTVTISVTESNYIVPGDGTNDFPEYPNEGAIRFDKTATAVGNFSETGLALVELSMTGVPYSSGSAIDALLVLDMSTSMETEVATDTTRYDVTAAATKAFIKTIVQNDDGTYNNNTVAVHYFNGTTAYTDVITDGFITISSDEELEAVEDKIDALMAAPPSTSGTDYTTSMKAAYNAIINRDAVSDNTQALVFMSDGGPTYYTYVNGTSYGTVSDDAATIVGWFDTDDNDTTDETDDTATPNSSFKNEYYSTLLKNAGYPVYTVGLGLSSNDTGPQAFTGLTSGAHEAITSYILSSMATNSSYFYNVADSDAVANMGNIFSGIAASIKEAATNVVVEDKIGNNYNVQFTLPDNVTSNETDGLSEFYIQVVDYVLDSTTHERTGVYTVLENFTFNTDGTVKSHTVDGAACGDTCSHVTITDGVVTAIDGTYFDYSSEAGTDEDGNAITEEYLTWNAEKLTSTELTLQYIAYLENSADKVGEAGEIPAGTYYTNEYATLTYTNYNGNEVQQEFPVPQMTWNGAQVSYVFYLVNEDGQPVNRAGRVVPFAEAVYVTDVYTYSVIWNDLEQSAGLEAKYLAEDLVPDVYALYDEGAVYNIHVYEDESEVNLNNHFVIGSSFDGVWNETDKQYYAESPWDSDSTADELAYTTYVFNNKSDTTKYHAKGAYIANDGVDTTASNAYLCKSAIIKNAAYTTTTDVNGTVIHTVTDLGDGYQQVDGETQVLATAMESTSGGTIINGYVYYVDENGDVYTIVQKTDGTEVHTGFDFSNTTVAFAVVWKPELVPDTVVVDYGLDVVIDVITNDGMAGGVVGVRADAPSNVTMNSGTYDAAKVTSADIYIDANNDTAGLKELKIATATVESLTSVRFSLDKTNGMQFTDPAVFYYEAGVNYYTYDADDKATLNTTSMYSSVTVIPAATVYYEDTFVTFTNYDASVGVQVLAEGATASSGTWYQEGTATNATQAVDRPGTTQSMSAAYDANNAYGYDSAYASCSTYSMNSAVKVSVEGSAYASASFEFYGTGFDLISMTNSQTGTVIVDLYAYDTAAGAYSTSTTRSFLVNTYYSDESGLYQIPVIEMSNLAYGRYKAVLTVLYNTLFDTAKNGSYEFYLDAIRVYDPTGVVSGETNSVVSDAYDADGEGWPVFLELRNNLIDAAAITDSGDAAMINGVAFIDGMNGLENTASVADYSGYGPNNELYLAAGQAIVFNLDLDTYGDTIASVQLGMKSADGGEISYKVFDGEVVTSQDELDAVEAKQIATATDMYYNITELKDSAIVIHNAGESGILSLTDIKITFTEDHGTTTGVQAYVDTDLLNTILDNLNRVEYEAPESTTDVTVEETKNDLFIRLSAPDSVTSGDAVTVTATTSADVDYVIVGGTTVTAYTEAADGNRVWTADIQASEVGVMQIVAYAYAEGEDGSADTVEAGVDVLVYAKDFTISAPEYVTATYGFTVTVTTGTDVESVTINGEACTGENGVWTLDVATTADNVGIMEFTAIGYADGEKIAEVATSVEVKALFAPETLSIATTPTTVYAGNTITVTITTSDDVDTLMVNDELLSTYSTSRTGTTRTWTVKIPTTEAGTVEISVVAYDENGAASAAVTKTVTVVDAEETATNILTTVINALKSFITSLAQFFGL